MGLFSKISNGLKKTRDAISSKVDDMIKSIKVIDEDFFEELEEILIMSDIGAITSAKICDELRVRVKKDKAKNPEDVKKHLRQIITEMMSGGEPLQINTKPSIILVIGVNGVGKTTTIGKLAIKLKNEGKDVILGAADTFRAAAIEQLDIWADRAGVEIVKHTEGADPAAVVFDTIAAAKARHKDVIICDTAGRLHNKKNLMDELNKITKIIDRELLDCNKEVILVLDATTGQNAVNQAREFKNTANITGIILTKLDGTAKGGVVIPIREELDVPVKYIGVGEQIDDLQEFDPEEFARAILGDDTDTSEE